MRRWPVLATLLGAIACGAAARETLTVTQAIPVAHGAKAVPPPAGPFALRVVDPARFQILARVPAFDAKADDGWVFVLDPEVAALHGFDLATGKEAWSTPLGVPPSGRVTIHAAWGSKHRVLVHLQNQLLLFERETGAVAARNAGPWNVEKTSFGADRGVCSFFTDCDLHFVDCELARPYGPVLRIAETHLYAKLGAPHDTVCWGPRHVVGRGGNVVVAVVDGRVFERPGVPPVPGPLTVGIDATTGKTLWSTPGLGCERCVASGVSPDGTTCWLASSAGELDVFACATGAVRFHEKLPPAALSGTQPRLYTAWSGSGLVLSTATEVALLDGTNGARRWSTPLPAKGIGLPLGTKLELPEYSTWEARTVLLVDPRTGKEAARFPLARYTELLQSADLGLRVKGGVAFDRQGRPRTFAEDAPPFALVRDVEPRRLTTGDGAHALLEGGTDLAIVAARRTPQGDEVALFVWGPPGAAGEVVFARVPSGG
jgi:hypothetical protein